MRGKLKGEGQGLLGKDISKHGLTAGTIKLSQNYFRHQTLIDWANNNKIICSNNCLLKMTACVRSNR